MFFNGICRVIWIFKFFEFMLTPVIMSLIYLRIDSEGSFNVIYQKSKLRYFLYGTCDIEFEAVTSGIEKQQH